MDAIRDAITVPGVHVLMYCIVKEHGAFFRCDCCYYIFFHTKHKIIQVLKLQFILSNMMYICI